MLPLGIFKTGVFALTDATLTLNISNVTRLRELAFMTTFAAGLPSISETLNDKGLASGVVDISALMEDERRIAFSITCATTGPPLPILSGAFRVNVPKEVISKSFDDLLSWYDAGDLKPHISHIFNLSDASKAMEMLKSRKSTGKVMLRI